MEGLIANGIVERRSYDEIPPRVEYSLTEKGASVVPILQSMGGTEEGHTESQAIQYRTQCCGLQAL